MNDLTDLERMIDDEIRPQPCDSADFFEEMESQSGYQLAEIYEPFDLGKRMHCRDEGHILDFLRTAEVRDGRVLDFGPGDGWPALPLARYARETDTDMTPTALRSLIGEGEVLLQESGHDVISQLRDHGVEARVCELRHPSAKALVRRLGEIGFEEVLLTHNGGDFAGCLFDTVPEVRRPTSHPELTAWLDPLVQVVVDLPAPIEMNPMVAAAK